MQIILKFTIVLGLLGFTFCAMAQSSNLLSQIEQENTAVKIQHVYSNKGIATERSIMISIPTGFLNSASSYPVIFAFHGTSKDGYSAAQNMVNSNLDANSVIIAPVGGQATDGRYSWNANGETQEDDVNFVKSVWRALLQDGRIDTARVYAYGHSVGASFLSNALLLDSNTGFIKGATCLSSTLLAHKTLNTASQPLSMIIVHGEDDPLIPIDGGAAKFINGAIQMGVNQATALWAEHNGCDGDYMSLVTSQYTKRYYPNCPAVVELYRLKNTDHDTVTAMRLLFNMSIATFMLHKFSVEH
jgi:poly(3-hydroxybutyrate) depolymerase